MEKKVVCGRQVYMYAAYLITGLLQISGMNGNVFILCLKTGHFNYFMLNLRQSTTLRNCIVHILGNSYFSVTNGLGSVNPET